MNKDKSLISIHKITKSFQKIYAGLNTQQLEELDKELMKMYPSENSEVLFCSDYGEEENSIGISIYVSAPKTNDNLQKISFDKLVFEYLIRADLSKLMQVSDCLKLMESKGTSQYEIDFVPVFYTKEIDKYDIHFRIVKKGNSA